MRVESKVRFVGDRAFRVLVDTFRHYGLTDDDIDDYLLDSVGEWRKGGAAPPPPTLLERRLDLESFLAESPKPMNWLVPGLLAQGETVNLAAKWGVGKTWFALDLALSIVDEGRKTFLGRPVKHGKVVYLDEESSEDIVRERLALLGARPDVSGNLTFLLQTGMKLTDSEAAARLYEAVAEVQPLLVVFDSLTRFYSGLDENNANDMAKLTEVIAPLSRDLGAAALLIDHGTKNAISDASNAARGSGEKAAGVDRVWHLTGDEKGLRLTHGKTRRGRTPPPLEFQRVSSREADSFMEPGGGSWHVGDVGVWHEMVSEAGSAQRSDTHNALVQALEARDGTMPMSEVVLAIYDGNRDQANRAVRSAELEGLVRREPNPADRRAKLLVLVKRQPEAA